MKRFFTFLKWIFIISILFVAHAYLTSNTHIFKTLGSTILKGRLGPSVDTRLLFSTRKIATGKPQPWAMDSLFGKYKIDDSRIREMEKYQTLAFLVTKDGKVRYEKYWSGYGSKSETNSWSLAKSIVSLLVGCAIKEGKIESVEQYAGDFLPEFKNTGLKIKHLLSMSSGINFKEQYANPYGYNAKSLYGTDLERLNKKYRVNNLPGKHFIYLSGNTQVLGFILTKATGMSLSEYASKKLWRKIGAEQPAFWSLDRANGMEKAFCCFHSNARDFAKVGQLMLQKGIWNQDTLISYAYYRSSITPYPNLQLSGEANHLYGYQWWIMKYKGHDIFYARGINGQYIIDIPDKNMVVVRLGRKRSQAKINGHPKDLNLYIDAALEISN